MKGRVEEEQLEEIRRRSDIVEVISESVPLRQRGKTYVGLCPFHREKTPSFTVTPERQMFYCFGCGVGGDVFKFIMEKERVGFAEALKILGDRAGIDIYSQESLTPQQRQTQQKIAKLKNIYEISCRYYQEKLIHAPEGEICRRYLQKRGIGEEIVQKFRLGFAPGGNGLLAYLEEKGFNAQELIEAGLVLSNREGDDCYDRFRHRLMFPICDHLGKVIAFGGRVLGDGVPKYLNSPETLIFSKGKHLYGLNLAKDKMRQERKAVLVEGYMDVLGGAQCGVEYVVASMGTALTENQIKLLKQYTEEVIIAYDADGAGMKAALRGIDMFHQTNLQLKIAALPRGMDPDDICRKYGIKGFENILNRAELPVTYQIKQILSQYQWDTIEGKMNIIHEVLPILTSISNEILKESYINKLASRLEVTPQAIYREIEKYSMPLQEKRLNMDNFRQKRNNNNDYRRIQRDKMQKISVQEIAQKDLLCLILKNPGSLIAYVKQHLPIEVFSDSQYCKLFQWLWEKDFEKEPLLETCNDEDIRKIINDLLIQPLPFDDEKAKEKALLDYIYQIKVHDIDKHVKEIQEKLQIVEGKEENTEKIRELQYQILNLQSQRNKLIQGHHGNE